MNWPGPKTRFYSVVFLVACIQHFWDGAVSHFIKILKSFSFSRSLSFVVDGLKSITCCKTLQVIDGFLLLKATKSIIYRPANCPFCETVKYWLVLLRKTFKLTRLIILYSSTTIIRLSTNWQENTSISQKLLHSLKNAAKLEKFAPA